MKYKIVAIASQPRSGSSYLCDLLQMTGMIGNGDNNEHTGEDGFFTPDLPSLLRDRTSKENIALIKLHFPGFVDFNRLDIKDFDLDIKWIWIKRNNTLAQVVSNVIAKYTKKWSVFEKEHRKINDINDIYDFHSISDEIKEITRRDYFYKRYFSLTKTPVLEFIYEEHIMNLSPYELIKRTIDFCEIDIDPDELFWIIDAIDPKKLSSIQRDKINDQMIERYLLDKKIGRKI